MDLPSSYVKDIEFELQARDYFLNLGLSTERTNIPSTAVCFRISHVTPGEYRLTPHEMQENAKFLLKIIKQYMDQVMWYEDVESSTFVPFAEANRAYKAA